MKTASFESLNGYVVDIDKFYYAEDVTFLSFIEQDCLEPNAL